MSESWKSTLDSKFGMKNSKIIINQCYICKVYIMPTLLFTIFIKCIISKKNIVFILVQLLHFLISILTWLISYSNCQESRANQKEYLLGKIITNKPLNIQSSAGVASGWEKTQQWLQDWKKSVFILIPNKGIAKKCSDYRTIAFISHASKVMLKIL